MKKKGRLIFISILMASMLLSACVSKAPQEKAEEGIPDVSDVTILEHPRNDMPEITHVFNKGVSFKVDKAHTKAINYIFGKKGQVLKLEDGNGLVWTLELPPDALFRDVKISMTALTDIKSGDLGAFNGGILFEPDRLRFSAPAKLTVTGKNVDEKCVLLSGDNGGKNLDFINLIKNEKGVSAEVAHFSTVYAAPPSANSVVAEQAKQSIEDATAQAKVLLKQPVEFPAPPAVSLECNHSGQDNSEKILDEYQKQFMEPEWGLIEKIISAEKTLLRIDSSTKTDWSILERLSYRLVKKSIKLIKTYSPQPDYFWAALHASFASEKTDVVISASQEESQVVPMMASWAQKVEDKFLDELVKNHDYKKIHPIIDMDRAASILNPGRKSNYLKALSDALQFRIEYECIVNFEAENPMGFATEGNIPLNLGLKGLDPDVTPNIGTGSGKYTGFISPDPRVGLVRPNVYDIHGQVINFLPCQYDNFDILIDMFGAKKEVMIAQGRTVPVDGIVQRMGIGAFHDKLATNPLQQTENGKAVSTVFYKFNLDVRNMNQTAGQKTFKADVGGQMVEFTLKLVHTPNGKGPSKSEDGGGKDPFAGKQLPKGDNGGNGPGGDNSPNGSEGAEDGNDDGNGSGGGSTDGGSNSQSGTGGLPASFGKLPEGFPRELVPLPDDAKILAGSGDASSGWTVVYTTGAKPPEAAEFVKNYMKSAEDYQVSDLGTGIIISGVKSKQQITVLIADSGGTTMVSISVGKL